MIRHVAAMAVVLCTSPAWSYAQNAELAVHTTSATVYKGPSTGSPVIGSAPRGTVLEVVRELGDWVKVTWPPVPDSTGYVRLSAGSLTRRSTAADSLRPGTRAGERSTPEASLSPAIAMNGVHGDPGGQLGPANAVYVSPRSHVIGLGGRVGGSTLGFGGTVRGWSQKRVGLQVEASRYALTSAFAPGRVTSIEVAPSMLYSFPDRVTDYVWLRPYAGAGANLLRATQAGFGSTSKLGFQAFGGGEFTFASVPRFALSTDLGYRWARAPYDGFQFGGLRLSVSGHWYLR